MSLHYVFLPSCARGLTCTQKAGAALERKWFSVSAASIQLRCREALCGRRVVSGKEMDEFVMKIPTKRRTRTRQKFSRSFQTAWWCSVLSRRVWSAQHRDKRARVGSSLAVFGCASGVRRSVYKITCAHPTSDSPAANRAIEVSCPLVRWCVVASSVSETFSAADVDKKIRAGTSNDSWRSPLAAEHQPHKRTKIAAVKKNRKPHTSAATAASPA